MNKIKWNEQFKIRIANSRKEFQKHEVVKLLIMMKLIEKHKSHKNWIRIYSEIDLENGLVPDLYFEDVKGKSIICYEIQKNCSEEYIKERTKKYNELNTFINLDLIIIPICELSNDITILNKELEKYIF